MRYWYWRVLFRPMVCVSNNGDIENYLALLMFFSRVGQVSPERTMGQVVGDNHGLAEQDNFFVRCRSGSPGSPDRHVDTLFPVNYVEDIHLAVDGDSLEKKGGGGEMFPAPSDTTRLFCLLLQRWYLNVGISTI